LHTAALDVLVALPAGTILFGTQNIIAARIRFVGAALSYHKWREPKKWKL
jgi:hypothetical protein